LNDAGVGLEFRVTEAKRLGGGLLNRKTVGALLEGLEVKSEVLRDAIRASLEKLKAAPELVAMALDAKLPTAERVAALGGLRSLKPTVLAGELAPLLTDKDAKVRAAVAQLYCVFGAASAEAPLVAALGDGEPTVRYFAVLACAALPGAKGAVKALAAKEQDAVVKDALAQALR
jgi:HEAT repeat protein